MIDGSLYDVEFLPDGEELSMSDHFFELSKNGCKTMFFVKDIESVCEVGEFMGRPPHVVVRFSHGSEVKLFPKDAHTLYTRILLRVLEALR